METFIDKKNSTNEVTLTASKLDKPSFFKGSSKAEDEVIIGVDWEGELIDALEYLNKSRIENKALKRQLK